MKLARYEPPSAQRFCVAAGLSPLLVLLSFTLIVIYTIDSDTAIATFLACSAWVFYELNDYQRLLDAYNEEYVKDHLRWRSSEALQALAAIDTTDERTRKFVLAWVYAGRVVQRVGPRSQV